MFNITTKTINWGGKDLTLETGKIARQATGAVLATYGETKLLATVVSEKTSNPELGFFPLTVQYQDKAYATGKIPGGFLKREGRPNDSEVLTSRLIDRPIRPLFPENFKNETQIIITTLSYDGKNSPDILALIASSTALAISGLPFQGPIGAVRVGYINEEFVLNPTKQEQNISLMDLVIAGTKEGVLMVESEVAELDETIMLDAVNFAHESYQEVITLINDFASECKKPDFKIADEIPEKDVARQKVTKLGTDSIRNAYKITTKLERQDAIADAKKEVISEFAQEIKDEENPISESMIKNLLKELEKSIVRKDLLKSGIRIDGRDTKTVRPIDCEVSLLPQSHGCALFTRGETQALVTTTLGTGSDEKIVDGLDEEYRERFMLHYNFPPYSVGECGRMGTPGRREIGHGKLAWRAINPMLPAKVDFPYTLRVVSEITESNGSSSMATVCGATLALMDAGVPLKKPVAGIAMGLIKEDDEFCVLTDIMGDEDHLGDMDFKVAGTKDGITSLQMDIKITSITKDIMKQALEQAHAGRLHILGEMEKALTGPREEVKDNAPRIEVIKIPPEKIGNVIGSGGKTIKEITETTNSKVDISNDGVVMVSSLNKASILEAIEWIKELTEDPEIGALYCGNVVKVLEVGAFVNFMGKHDGFIHISEFTNERVENINDVVKEGQQIKVKLLGTDRGKYKLSARLVDQDTGEELEDLRPPKPPRNDDDRGGYKKNDRNDRHDRNDRNDRNHNNKRRDNRNNRNNNDEPNAPLRSGRR